MYVCKSIPTLLPDAVLRCRKLQAAADVELDEMKKLTFRRINKLEWQQQTFQKTVTERHQKWRIYDQAFRLKLKQELNADLVTAFNLRTIQDEEEKLELMSSTVMRSNSARPKSDQARGSVNKGSQSAVGARRAQHTTTKANHPTSAVNQARRLSARRPRTSRFDTLTRRDPEHESDYHTVLFRIISNIAPANIDFTNRKRIFEARDHRLICTNDDRYFNLVKQLVPQRLPYEKDTDIEKNQRRLSDEI